MADIASLGIRVQTQGAKEAAADLDKLQQSGARAEKATQSFGKGASTAAKSAKELQFATRNLPAQFTDIATALGSGQRPLQVLLQQGGQIKDMFGGVGPAIRAVTSSVVGMINPYTVAAAAIVAVGAAWNQAANESEAFNKALILTGNNAGLTEDKLRAMAAQLDATTNASAGRASDVLAQVTATGKFTADQIQLIAEAAIRMQDATGQAVEETVKQFTLLTGDPVDAILKLNDSQNFLTQSTLDSIRELKAQGKEAEAAAVAIKAYADTINTRAPQVEAHLSQMTLLFRDLKQGAAEGFDAVVDGFRESETAATSAKNAFLSALSALPLVKSAAQFGFKLLDVQQTANQARSKNQLAAAGVNAAFDFIGGNKTVNSGAERAREAAADEFGKIVESHLSRQKKLESEIAHIREVGRKAGIDSAKIEEQVSAARAAAARTGGGGGSRVRASRAASLPDFSKTAADDLKRQAEAEDRATQAFLDMQAALDGPLAQAEREHAKRVQQLNELAAQSPQAAAGLAAAMDKEAAAHAKNVEAIKAELDPLGQMAADMQFELDMIGKSNAERAVMIELRRNHIDALSAEGQAALANARAFEQEADAKQRSIDLMDDFRRGAAEALTDFVTGAKSAKDALKDFFNTLAEEITRAIAQQWIKQLFVSPGASGQGTSGGSFLGSIFGAIFGGGWGGIAKGEAFPAGVTAFANGGVVSSPHLFASAGRLGLMGEAGPEAILPLHRGPDGKLGVRMEAANQPIRREGGNVYVTVPVEGHIDRRTKLQTGQEAGRAVARARRNA